jgi:uncharacterized protein YigA (DUF484 family)
MTQEQFTAGEEMESEVADYIERHPDFFHRHPNLVTALTLPHPASGKAVSLVERQVVLLREQKLELKHKLQNITQIARSNEELLERFQTLILDLIDSPSLERALQVLESSLRSEFHAEAVVVWLFAPGAGSGSVAPDDPRVRIFQRLMDQGRPACGALRPEQITALFGDQVQIGSGALVPLCEGEGVCVGLVGIGSADPKRYHPEMGTVFLRHLGAVAARVVRARLGS